VEWPGSFGNVLDLMIGLHSPNSPISFAAKSLGGIGSYISRKKCAMPWGEHPIKFKHTGLDTGKHGDDVGA
jgi:hypothetical protein